MIASSQWSEMELSGAEVNFQTASKQDYSRFVPAQENPASNLAGGTSFETELGQEGT